ncbi:MAG: hypothetical protein RLN72_01230, partial [Henriciella sp.]
MTKRKLMIRLAAPRGFCAGVDRAIQIVEEALTKWGAPVYVRHEIVHNHHVVSRPIMCGASYSASTRGSLNVTVSVAVVMGSTSMS